MCAAVIQSRRNRKVPCPCSLCNGRQCDKRTVTSHALRSTPTISSVVEEQSPTDDNSSGDNMTDENHPVEEGMEIERSYSDKHDVLQSDDPQTTHTLKLDNDLIRMYVMREAKAKLENESSVTEIERHLRNAAA